MKNMDQIIRMKIMEIIFVCLFLVGSFFIWNELRNSETIELVRSINPNASVAYVDIVKESNYRITAMNDDEAQKTLIPKTIQMVNSTYSKTNYIFGLKVNKVSTLDYKTIKYSINEEVSFLKDAYIKEDDQYYYFILDKGDLQTGSKNYEVRFWIDENTMKIYPNQSLLYEFDNLADTL